MLLNAISYNYAYSLYPRATLHERRTLILYDEDGVEIVTDQGTTDYQDLHFETLEKLDESAFTKQDRASPFPLGWRSPHDLHTWKLPLPSIGIMTAPSHDPLSICSFLLRYSVTAMTTVTFRSISPVSLKYDYIVADKELLYHLEAELIRLSPVWDGIW